MVRKLKVFFCAACEDYTGRLCDCVILATNYDVAERKAEKEFRDYFDYCFTYEVVEQEDEDAEEYGGKAGIYDAAPLNYAYYVFC